MCTSPVDSSDRQYNLIYAYQLNHADFHNRRHGTLTWLHPSKMLKICRCIALIFLSLWLIFLPLSEQFIIPL